MLIALTQFFFSQKHNFFLNSKNLLEVTQNTIGKIYETDL